ncbi:MAG: methyltransferase domain-containing protein, partial [Pseudomonadales bacterium]
MASCRICDSKFERFISFGNTPIANGFLLEKDFPKEYFFELATGFCQNCYMVQLIEQPQREQMFHEEYAFFSSLSEGMRNHFRGFAEKLKNEFLNKDDPFAVEIGSNDGIMLKNLCDAGIRHLGIEPSANVARAAMDNGVNTVSRFFDEDLANEIVDQYGYADTITSANVICHIPYLHSVFSGIEKLLKPDGVFIFEDPYLGDI